MAYNEQLADRIRERFAELPDVEEKYMMGGLAMMYKGKMCVGVLKDELMCRVDPALVPELLEKQGCRPLTFTGRVSKGFVLVDETGMRTKKAFDAWIDLALAFNQHAKPAKKRK